jgi:hypothetical protein
VDDLILLMLIEVDAPDDQLIPLSLIDSFDLVGQLIKLLLELLDAAIDIALLGLGNDPELVLLLDDFGEVPELGGAGHLDLEVGVPLLLHLVHDGGRFLHFGGLPAQLREQAVPDYRVLDVLLHCLVNALQLLGAVLEHPHVLLVDEALPDHQPPEFSHVLLLFLLFDGDVQLLV